MENREYEQYEKSESDTQPDRENDEENARKTGI